MNKKKALALILTIFAVSCSTSCVNLQSVEDFGNATSQFSVSYDAVYYGSYDTCLSSAELDHVLKGLRRTPEMTTLQQLEEDKKSCEPYKTTGEIYRNTALALGDFGSALAALASKGNLLSGRSVDFTPQFKEITQNLGEVLPQLKQHEDKVDKVNQLARILVSLYVKRQAAELIAGTESEVTATLELLGVLAELYQSELNIYKENIRVVDENPLFEEKNQSEIQKSLVIEHINNYDGRKELLDNYSESLQKINQSHQEILQRAKLGKPHFDDPIFQQQMRDFLSEILNLVQKSRSAVD